MSVICHIDGSEHASVADVHALLKSLRFKQADYYARYHPRVCRGSGEPIPYKDHKQYFTQEFKDKESLKKWIHANPVEGKTWAIDWLRKRKEEKSLIYAPSQVELESLNCPSMRYYDWVGGYYSICRELEYADRYEDMAVIGQDIYGRVYWSQMQVICDTREQAPLSLQVPTIRAGLNWGDYALAAPHDRNIRIERKSLSDFVGTLSGKKVAHKRIAEDSPSERFERELIRAKEDGGYLIMMVEAPIKEALDFRESSQIKHGKASPSHIFKNLRDLLVKYPLTWQVIFVKNHTDAATKLIRLFKMGDQVKKIDLQFALEKGLL